MAQYKTIFTVHSTILCLKHNFYTILDAYEKVPILISQLRRNIFFKYIISLLWTLKLTAKAIGFTATDFFRRSREVQINVSTK